MKSNPVVNQTDRGAVAVELALVLVVLIPLVFGIIQFGMYFNQQQGVHAAAREGARVASLPTSTAGQVQARVRDALDDVAGIDPSSASITISPATCLNHSGETITVTVSAGNFNFNIPFVPGLGSHARQAKGKFRCE